MLLVVVEVPQGRRVLTKIGDAMCPAQIDRRHWMCTREWMEKHMEMNDLMC